jgi:hypothetical protein
MNFHAESVRFFCDIWAELGSEYLKSARGLRITGPHILVAELITEIEENQVNNTKNIKYFKKALEEYCKSELSRLLPDQTSFKELSKYLHLDKERPNFILQSAKVLLDSFESGEYFNNLLNSLINVFSDTEIQKFQFQTVCRTLAEQLFVELVLKGYTIDEVSKIADKVFSTVKQENGRYISNFPINKITEIDNRSLENCREYVNQLDDCRRIKFIRRYFLAVPHDYFCVFCVEGIKQISTELSSGILLRTKRSRVVKFDQTKISLVGLLLQERKDNYPYVIVKTCSLSPQSAIIEAFTKLEQFSGLVSIFARTKIPIRAIRSKYAIFDSTGQRELSNYSSDRVRNKKHINEDSFDLLKYDYIINDYVKPAASISNLTDYSKVMTAVHWYSKGQSSLNITDKLLFFWIAIEYIFNIDNITPFDAIGDKNAGKIDVIKKGISSAMLLSEIHDSIWGIYYHFKDKFFWHRAAVPNELIVRANLYPKEDEYVKINKFFETIPELLDHESNEETRSKFTQIYESIIHHNNHLKIVNSILSRIESEVHLLYRFRNMIVHNAKYDGILLPYYAWIAGDFAGVLIRSLFKGLQNQEPTKLIIFKMLNQSKWYAEQVKDGRIPWLTEDDD